MIHCRACWQPMSALSRRCRRCGDVDSPRRHLAVAKFTLFVALTTLVVGLTVWLR
ncbi:MAG TPA: hypothetical protein VFI31_11025 [Pirellulales bacterium]|nr:hypothetical protein [Pirellulales bacterium]